MKKLTLLTLIAGLFFASCKKEAEPTLQQFTLSKTTLTLKIGESEALTPTNIQPAGYKLKNVEWKSSDETIATVSATGGVHAKGIGETVVTATSEGKVATCRITVEAIAVVSVALDKQELTLQEGNEHQFTATVLPENATDKTLTWSSSGNSVVTIDETGKAQAKKPGNAVITATSATGNISATCKTTVTEKTYAPLSKLLLPYTEWGKTTADIRTYEKANGGTEKEIILYDEDEETYYSGYSVVPTDKKPIVHRGYILDKKTDGKLISAEIVFPLETIFQQLPNGGGTIRDEFTTLMTTEGFSNFSFPFPGVTRAYANKSRNLLLQLRIVKFKETGDKQFASLMVIPYSSLFG